MKCDVLILGGGAAGIAAAVTAARSGAHTILIERHGSLGGMATASLVHSICGLYLLREDPGAIHAHSGFPIEFSNLLIQSGASPGPVRMGRLDVLPHSPPGFAIAADQITTAEKNLQIHLHTELINILCNSNLVTQANIISRGKIQSIHPTSVVDASGDAIASSMAGAECTMADSHHLQRPAFVFSFHSVEVSSLHEQGRIELAGMIAKAVRDTHLPPAALGAQFRTTGRGSEVFVTVDLAAQPDYDPTHPAQLTALEKDGRAIASSLRAYLRSKHPAFRIAEFAAFPTRVGIRESRRILGKSTITAADVLAGTPQKEVVALGTWPIELREKATGPRWKFPAQNRPTQIPLGALQAAHIPNLWAAGRCISCEHEAQAAIRVIGTCLATGQAAGAAAALQSQGTSPLAPAVQKITAIHPAQ